jgi:hypothetical protein
LDKKFLIIVDPVFFFVLIKPFGFAQGEKIKAANKKAENFNIILKSRNSPPIVQYFEA